MALESQAERAGRIEVVPGETPEPSTLMLPFRVDASSVLGIVKNLRDAGHNVELIIIDTKGEPKNAAKAVSALIKEEVKLILGPFFSGSTEAITPLAQAAQIPVISFSNNKEVAGDGVYVFGFLPGQQITRILEYSLTRGYRRIGTFVPENDFPPRLSRFKIHLFLIQTRNPARSEEHFATVRGR